jgi:hypothetical protein
MAIAASDVSTDPQNVASERLSGRHSDGELVSYVMSRVVRWRTTRDSNYFDLWDMYYAIWRGQWNAKLKQRDSERSKIITPATQQAVDATVSEMVEATFGRGDWFDIREPPEPIGMQQNQQLQQAFQMKKKISESARDQMLEDFERDRVQHAIIETYLNGAIYGTGISKRIVENKTITSHSLDSYGNPMSDPQDTVCVYWQSIPPYNFVIDTAALTVEDAHGVAHETIRPISEIESKQSSGEYFNVPIGSASGYATGIIARGPKGENLEVNILDGTYITEYHGKVPRKYLEDNDEDTPPDPLAAYGIEDGDQHAPPEDVVEAIIVIANGNALLKKQANPYPGGDRGFVAYQHDRVPNRFWGRGVVEKAYNAQVALDAEIRARIDAMALMTYPMVGFDATRLPRNLNLQVRPGKTFLTNGDPETIIRPIEFGQSNPAWFEHSGDLERMVGTATGTFDPGSPGPQLQNNGTASAASMALGTMIKRAKLTMQTVDIDYLDVLVRKSYLAYQILSPDRYPNNAEFVVNSSMSIMAREFEQTQMTNLLAIVPPQSPAFYVILKAIAENYSGPSRTALCNAIDQMLQPNPQQQQMQQMQQRLQIEGAQAEVAKLKAEVQKLQAEVPVQHAKAQDLQAKAQAAPVQAQVQRGQLALEAHKTALGVAQLRQDDRHHKDDHLVDMLGVAQDAHQHHKEHSLATHQLVADSHHAKADRWAKMATEKAKMESAEKQAEMQAEAAQEQGGTNAPNQ